MYSTRPGLILAFHGCDQSVAQAVLNGNATLNYSTNKYDWLGHGIYFWDNSPSRALEYARFLRDNPLRSKRPVQNPSVIGAVINLGLCLDLLDYQNLAYLKQAYGIFRTSCSILGKTMPVNKTIGVNNDPLLRELDCSVIETLHEFRKFNGMESFDSVRGVFWEGDAIYNGAGFKEKNHIQICVGNPNCIKGFFLERSLTRNFKRV